MSNESQSPPLRLKPRLSPIPSAASPEPAAVPPASPVIPAAATPSAPVPPLPTLVAPPPLPTVVPRPLPPEPVPAPVSSVPVPAPSPDDPGKFKLKPRGAAAAPAATPSPVPEIPSTAVPPVPQTGGVIPVLRLATAVPTAVPAPAQAVTPGSVPIVKPTLPAAALASPAFAKPAAPASGRPNMPIAPLPPSGPIAIPNGGVGPRPQGKLVAQNQDKDVARGKFALKLLFALLFVAVVISGVFAYNLWFSAEPAPEPVIAKRTPPSTSADKQTAPATEAGHAPAAVVETAPATEPSQPANPVVTDTPQSLPGQLIAQAQDAVKAHDAALTQPTNEVLNSTVPATPPTATIVPAPVEMKPVPAPEPVAAPRPEPSANFKAFVVNLKINGVFQGENSRAMLNGKMYRLGEVVDAKLGIVFLRLEPEGKRIVFEDSKGAIMSRRY